jgi:hypothetical protein
MVSFVEIAYGVELSYPPARSINAGSIIGFSSVVPATNPFRVTSISSLTEAGIPTTSQLYKACVDFLAATAGTSAYAWAYAVNGAGTSYNDVSLLGQINTSNTTFYSPYYPLLSISGIEINYDNSGWYGQQIYTTGVTSNAIDGKVLFTAGTGFIYSGVLEGLLSGFFLQQGRDGIRADVIVPAISEGFNALLNPDYDFNIFTFGYDQSLGTPLDPNQASAFKYASGQCYSTSGWFGDLLLGKNMATMFNSAGKQCIFYTALPDSVREYSTITGYAGGTTYSGSKFSDLPSLVGTTPYLAIFPAKQNSLGADPAEIAMGLTFKSTPRTSLMYAELPANSSQTVYPSDNETYAWRTAKMNPFIEIVRNGLKTWHIGGNNTFGSGREKDINFVRCRGLVKNMLMDNLQTLLLTRALKYDLKGIDAIIATIQATKQDAFNKGYIDGIGTTTVPIRSYIQNEASLDTGQKAVLLNARGSKVVGDIVTTFVWNGDIEAIVIRALGVE